jgi:tRNA A-37 threonylcarbamoyl transferase component Bud32
MNDHPETEAGANQTRANECPVCRAALPPQAPRGLCPRCLLEGAAAPTEDGLPAAGHRHPAPALEQIAAAFPQFEILGLIGVGGMGAVYKARQRHLDRLVALKILPETLAARPAFAERFNREARVLARLNHPNIVTVHDFGQSGGFFYLLMEYVDGVNLRQAMRASRFTPSQALDLVPRICEALQFAHDEGILHRDIKPENILLDTRDRVKIADFGIAKLVGDSAPDVTLTVSGAALGTPAYMAPEQIERPAEVDHRADIYSLGVVLYEMLTGELPLGRFAAPSEKTPVDRRVDDLVFRALEKEPEKRFQSATEVRTGVQDLSHPPIPAASAPSATGSAGGRAPTTSGLGVVGAEGGGGITIAVPGSPTATRPDFILCHPALPRMAKAISVYGLVLAPALLLISLGEHDSPEHTSPYAQFIQHLLDAVVVLGDLIGTGLLVTGAWMLRGLRPSAPRVLALAIWLRLALFPLVLLGLVWIEKLAPTPESATPTPPLELLGLIVGVGGLAFEVAALTWLYRHRDILQACLVRGGPATPNAMSAPAAFGPPPATVPYASLSAILTSLSLALGLPVASGLGMWIVALRVNPRTGGFGPFEVGLSLGLAAIVFGLGAAGLLSGLRALRRIREAGQALYGTRRAVLGAFGWPLALVAIAAHLGAGFAFFRLCDTALMAAVITFVFALGSTELAIRGAWRWISQTSPGQPGAQPPAWTHGLATVMVVATAIALFPPAAVSFGNALRASLPPMVVTLTGDPGVPPDTASDRSAMQLSLGCPPRSIVRVQTALLQGDQLLRSPLSEFHFVNPQLEASDHSLLIRMLAADPGGGTSATGQWELVARADHHTHTYGYSAEETRDVRWTPVGIPSIEPAPVGKSTDVEILRGSAPDGTAWSVRLMIHSDPLVPAIDVGEKTLLAPGNDWSATVKAAGLDKGTQ